MRVLLVEDEPDLLSGLRHALRREGYAVDAAGDGEEGLRKALAVEYDLVVLDVMLPGLDGWEILRRLRRERSVPVLMLTARDTTADRVRGLDSGADDYLVKPFDVPELLARVRALIRRAGGEPRPVIEAGAIRIDAATRRVTLDGRPVVLTAREYAVLHFLALHRGKVITRTQLYEHVFDENDDTLSNLIDVHIFNLRKKLGHDAIRTIRGHGYLVP